VIFVCLIIYKFHAVTVAGQTCPTYKAPHRGGMDNIIQI
jgi:hypothetical protein